MKRTIHYTLCLCTALLALSCTKEMETEVHPAMPEPSCRVEFRIETEAAEGIAPVGEAATRATDNAVRNLNFYVYGSGGLVRSGYTASAFVPTMTLVPGTYRVYLIANAGSSLGQMDEAQLLALSTPVTGQDGFLQNGAMYLSGMQTMTVAGNTTCRIVLRRAAAKISINVHLGPQMEDARIVHVVPGNAPATGSVFGENRLSASDPQIEFPYADLSPGNLPALSMSYYQYENMAGSVASQHPVRSACTETSDPAKRTVTDSPFAARPHMRIGRSRCKTMLSLKNLGIDTSACAVCHVTRKAKSVKTKLFIVAFSFNPQFSRQTHLRVRDVSSRVRSCRYGSFRVCSPKPCDRRSRRRGRSSPRP